MSCAASMTMRDAPSSNRPISFIRPVRSNSLSRSTSPEPQIPSGVPFPMTPRRKRAVGADRDILDRAVEPGHAAGDRAAFKRRPGRARCRQDAVLVAQDQLRIGADVHHRHEAIFAGDSPTANMHAAASAPTWPLMIGSPYTRALG